MKPGDKDFVVVRLGHGFGEEEGGGNFNEEEWRNIHI